MTTITYADVNEDILRTLERPKPAYFLLVAGFATALLIGALSVAIQVDVGMGVSGISHPIGWGVYITNFVFWIGIGHAGTLISAVFFLTRAPWRPSVYRAAEGMTVFAVMTAGLFPLIHVGRIWYAFWLIPYPNQRMLWVNFKSPLLWDVFAVSTYLTISITFFVIGMIPDLAALRDRATGIRKLIYTQLAVGWNNSYQQWIHYTRGYLLLAALATPLVFSVHSIVSWDFAMSLIPGWHTTIFAPYFVAGAIFSGLAMVLTIVIPMRAVFGWEKYITEHVMQSMAKVILFTSIIVGYAYASEFFIAWYSGNVFERGLFYFRLFGEPASHAPFGDVGDMTFPQIAFFIMVFCNVIAPIPLWRYKIRTNVWALFFIAILINIGMWFERFNIVVSSLQRDFNPANWGTYYPTIVESGITLGSFGFFFTLFALFARAMPSLAIAEVKEGLAPPRRNPESDDAHGHD
ncbi:MAG: polysulfide reductase NrfD [SAR324 cluster bacterium]|nr:polysulfide reductase NrfD [SAR324 cluster bacterium]MCZ6844113.1 polysulfide reductase NrfD [SAR324 cluster bacterium]